MTLSEIYFNYEQAIRQADELDRISNRVKDAASEDLDDIIGEVNHAWKSDSSNEYLKKMKKVQDDMGTTAGNLTRIASAIRTIAGKVREAELEAWRIANARL